ncbi:unnamed protein product [Angiostrongylus costaricensis]|uniref:BRCT domain-containing protein n=1 Tax=Angiostrongylus costaricensis TaxID=334426 RepID=A0A0R3PSZ2_ANGCS|nr:unnamed protein product [Angiostrongylus costaricensis]
MPSYVSEETGLPDGGRPSSGSIAVGTESPAVWSSTHRSIPCSGQTVISSMRQEDCQLFVRLDNLLKLVIASGGQVFVSSGKMLSVEKLNRCTGYVNNGWPTTLNAMKVNEWPDYDTGVEF